MGTIRKPASMAVSSFLDKPGQFHFLVNLADEQPAKKTGELIDGIRLELACLAGTDETQVKRTFDPILYNPSESNRDGGAFKNLIQARAADACCIMPDAAADTEVEVDWSKAKGAQVIAYVIPSKDPKFFEIDGAHIYHVDDPEVSHVPKNEAMLRLIPAHMRRIKQAPPAGKQSKTANAASKTPPTTVTKPAEETFDPDNL
jgi:hypothetical protein